MTPSPTFESLGNQVSIRIALQMVVFFVAGILLMDALIRVPITLFDTRAFLYLLIGIVASPFLGRDLALRYFTYWIMLSGGAGLMFLVVKFIDPGLRTIATGISEHSLLVALVYYGVLFAIGLLMLRRFRVRNRNAASNAGKQ